MQKQSPPPLLLSPPPEIPPFAAKAAKIINTIPATIVTTAKIEQKTHRNVFAPSVSYVIYSYEWEQYPYISINGY